MVWAKEKYILLDVLVCIAKYFCECCRILASPQSRSKYKLRVKILSNTTHQIVYHVIYFLIALFIHISHTLI